MNNNKYYIKLLVIIAKEFIRDGKQQWSVLPDIGYNHTFSLFQGACVGGHDDTTGDHPSANAADSSAASPVSSAAPSPSPAAAGSHAAAGNVDYLLWCSSMVQKLCT